MSIRSLQPTLNQEAPLSGANSRSGQHQGKMAGEAKHVETPLTDRGKCDIIYIRLLSSRSVIGKAAELRMSLSCARVAVAYKQRMSHRPIIGRGAVKPRSPVWRRGFLCAGRRFVCLASGAFTHLRRINSWPIR